MSVIAQAGRAGMLRSVALDNSDGPLSNSVSNLAPVLNRASVRNTAPVLGASDIETPAEPPVRKTAPDVKRFAAMRPLSPAAQQTLQGMEPCQTLFQCVIP